jgi:hypothetical protein
MGGLTNMHNELYNLYFSADMIRKVISQIRQAGHVAGTGALEIQREDLKGIDHLEVQGINGRMLE